MDAEFDDGIEIRLRSRSADIPAESYVAVSTTQGWPGKSKRSQPERAGSDLSRFEGWRVHSVKDAPNGIKKLREGNAPYPAARQLDGG
jgi:hypothetical protein